MWRQRRWLAGGMVILVALAADSGDTSGTIIGTLLTSIAR
jgi:hypothetical protein